MAPDHENSREAFRDISVSILSEVLDMPPEEIGMDMSLADIDTGDRLLIMAELRNRGIHVQGNIAAMPKFWERIKTVGDIAELISPAERAERPPLPDNADDLVQVFKMRARGILRYIDGQCRSPQVLAKMRNVRQFLRYILESANLQDDPRTIAYESLLEYTGKLNDLKALEKEAFQDMRRGPGDNFHSIEEMERRYLALIGA